MKTVLPTSLELATVELTGTLVHYLGLRQNPDGQSEIESAVRGLAEAMFGVVADTMNGHVALRHTDQTH